MSLWGLGVSYYDLNKNCFPQAHMWNTCSLPDETIWESSRSFQEWGLPGMSRSLEVGWTTALPFHILLLSTVRTSLLLPQVPCCSVRGRGAKHYRVRALKATNHNESFLPDFVFLGILVTGSNGYGDISLGYWFNNSVFYCLFSP